MAQVIHTVSRDHTVVLEKVGVILGFVLGLALAVGFVGLPLIDAGAPEVLAVALVVAIVAVCTRLGLGVVRALVQGD
jgi:hypothetical protein